MTFSLPFVVSSMRTSGSSLNKASSCREESSPVSGFDIFAEFSVDRLITRLYRSRSKLKTECSGSRALSHVTH